MRKLTKDEIECRVAQVSAKGCSLLLYKTARVDRAILDEEFGAMNWQNDFKVIDGKMYGGIGVRYQDEHTGHTEWVWKWDCGTESNTEAEKGQASDCFKRAGFKWGIGIELYSAPFIWLNVPTQKREDAKSYTLVNRYAKFTVKEIGYNDLGEIDKLVIIDENHKVVFKLGSNEKPNDVFADEICVKYTDENEDKIVCEKCGKVISQKISDYSMAHYFMRLCMDCQKEVK